ncbi:MAG: hypothetical protein HKN20_14600 [Gemmatimonadetes bacterium]|nr:hypothetical protein [Gemmatimonadota bacterium]
MNRPLTIRHRRHVRPEDRDPNLVLVAGEGAVPMIARSPTFVLLTFLLFAASVWGDGAYVELDIDGVIGNGPDHAALQVGDTVTVEAWTFPAIDSEGFYSITLALESFQASLLSWTYDLTTLAAWTMAPAESLSVHRWKFQATNFTFGGCFPTPPYRFGAAVYLYQGPGAGRVEVVEPSGYFSCEDTTSFFTNNIDATFGPTTATEYSSWSRVKELFR